MVSQMSSRLKYTSARTRGDTGPMTNIADASNGAALLAEAEAQQYLGIGHTTLYRLSASGALPSVSIGRRRLWRKSDLAAFVAALPATRPSRNRAL
jgi:excisionase family DNA binding protein